MINKLAFTLFLLVLINFYSSTANAEKLTAICNEPKGWFVGVMNGQLSQGADKISGGTPTYTWNIGDRNATVITQNTQLIGGTPFSYDAAVILSSKRQVSFIINYDGGIELHSLYIDTGDLFISVHKDFASLKEAAATGKILHASCKIASNASAPTPRPEPTKLISSSNDIQLPKWANVELWRKLQVGMTKVQVQEILGEPDQITVITKDMIIWKYSTLVFGKEGNLTFINDKLSSWVEPDGLPSIEY